MLNIESEFFLPDGVSLEKLQTANIVGTTTKVKERREQHRKELIDLPQFISMVLFWQKERPPLYYSDLNIGTLLLLSLGEIDEVDEHRQAEGLPKYNFTSEVGEIIDTGFFFAALDNLVRISSGEINYDQAMVVANGQLNGSRALERLREVVGNISERTLEQDIKYLWILWVSYLIHMKFPVNPNEVLVENVIPKNNGNHPRELLGERKNELFEIVYNRAMDKDEQLAYFVHFGKAMRIIRDFFIRNIDSNVEYNGLTPDQYRPYKFFIFNFTDSLKTGISPEESLVMLKDQLYKDHQIVR